MPSAPVHRMRKEEIVWLGNHKCEHGHTYLEHYTCYLKDNPIKVRIGFFDIETSNLDANFGIILAYWFKEANKEKFHGGYINSRDVIHDEEPDRNLVIKLIDDLRKFDLVFTYYGTKFDLPFCRTRALHMGLDFPLFGTIKHKDVYYIIKNKFKLHRNRLEVACRELLGETRKSHFDGNMWRRAVQGDKKSLTYISDHCKDDVRDLEDLTNKVLDYAYPLWKSI